ncbi:MAG: L,D-transpeptidase family protein [Deltaproteobacteria bacterium]|nr:L,D-transpeptidase family protein [Deltaproteobacteria bacterium]
MKKFRSYRYSSTPPYLKIGIALIAILILINAALSYLFIKERNHNKNLRNTISETSKDFNQIDESLRQKDYQKAFRHLTEARKQIATLLPPTPQAPPKPTVTASAPPAPAAPVKATTAPPQPVASLPSPAQESPQPLVLADAGEYLLVCEKETKTLYIFRFSDGKFSPVKQYPCIIGANNHEKRRDGDFATPVGVYFFLRFASGSTLPEIYGYGAYVLNYPNYLDRREGKKGGGIWIHGHSAGKIIGKEIPDTKGCIAVSNDALKEMGGFLKPNGTPIAIVNKLQFSKRENQAELSKDLTNFLNAWRQAWESINTKKFMSFYAPEFVNSEGMGYQAFKQQKEKVNKGKKFIRVKTENIAILIPQEYGGKIAIVRFLQRYHSNNFNSDSKKIFYLKKGQTGWQIIGESSY